MSCTGAATGAPVHTLKMAYKLSAPRTCKACPRLPSRGRTHVVRALTPEPSGGVNPILAQGGSPLMAPRTADAGMDPYGLLLRERIVILGGEVTDFSADAVISQLLLLDSTDPKKDIKLFINSPGGSVSAGMGIYDTMQLCRADISTYCFGLAASMGAFLLGAGTQGKRYSMPNARIMIHQPLGGASGQAIDVEIQAREMMYQKSNINRIMSEYTGQTVEKVEADTDRDRYMSPLESKAYGIIDHVVGGDDAGYDMEGSTTAFPRNKPSYDAYGLNEDPDRFRGSRFRKATEPYVEPLAPDQKIDETQ